MLKLPELQEKIHENFDEYCEILPELKKYLKASSKSAYIIFRDYFNSTSLYNIPIQPEIEKYRDIIMNQCSYAFCMTYINPKIAKYTAEYFLSKAYYQMINSIHKSIYYIIFR